MNKRTAWAAATVAAVITFTGASAAIVNVGLLDANSAEPAGELSPVDPAVRETKARDVSSKIVVVKPKERTRGAQVVRVPAPAAAQVSAPVSGSAPLRQAPVAASGPGTVDDDEGAAEYEHEEDAADHQDEDSDDSVDAQDHEEEHEGAEDDD